MHVSGFQAFCPPGGLLMREGVSLGYTCGFFLFLAFGHQGFQVLPLVASGSA